VKDRLLSKSYESQMTSTAKGAHSGQVPVQLGMGWKGWEEVPLSRGLTELFGWRFGYGFGQDGEGSKSKGAFLILISTSSGDSTSIFIWGTSPSTHIHIIVWVPPSQK
jgi:hypothetical protein